MLKEKGKPDPTFGTSAKLIEVVAAEASPLPLDFFLGIPAR
jgi:hypothetical protein